MKKLHLDEVKMIQLTILKDFAKFCHNNEIPFFLCGGTLLGAIRHRGFIPWDDDIDIMMFRKDYERFLILTSQERIGEEYVVNYYRVDDKYNMPFAKVGNINTIYVCHTQHIGSDLNISIDLFPLDNIPDNWFYRELQQCIHDIVFILLKAKTLTGSTPLRRMIVKILRVSISRFLSISGLQKKIDKNASKYQDEQTAYVACIVGAYGRRERIRREAFVKFIDVEFEGEIFKGPAGYHESLTNLFGDYMTPPPPGKRLSSHKFTAYLKADKKS